MRGDRPVAAVRAILAARMKAARRHRVPLSSRALSVPGEAHREPGPGADIVFPLPTGLLPRHRPMGALLRKPRICAAPHECWSSFRDWAAGCTDETPRELCELALAHFNDDRVEAAYRRSDLFDRRRELMPQWDDHVGSQDGSCR